MNECDGVEGRQGMVIEIGIYIRRQKGGYDIGGRMGRINKGSMGGSMTEALMGFKSLNYGREEGSNRKRTNKPKDSRLPAAWLMMAC